MPKVICGCPCRRPVPQRREGSGRRRRYINDGHKRLAWSLKHAGVIQKSKTQRRTA